MNQLSEMSNEDIRGAVAARYREVAGTPDAQDEIGRVLDTATDDEWRLLIALARYGAMRVPSEPLALTWGDIDFE